MKSFIAVLALLALLTISSAQIQPVDFSTQLSAFAVAAGQLETVTKASLATLSVGGQANLSQFATAYFQSIEQAIQTIQYNTAELAKGITAMKLQDYNQQVLQQLNG